MTTHLTRQDASTVLTAAGQLAVLDPDLAAKLARLAVPNIDDDRRDEMVARVNLAVYDVNLHLECRPHAVAESRTRLARLIEQFIDMDRN